MLPRFHCWKMLQFKFGVEQKCFLTGEYLHQSHVNEKGKSLSWGNSNVFHLSKGFAPVKSKHPKKFKRIKTQQKKQTQRHNTAKNFWNHFFDSQTIFKWFLLVELMKISSLNHVNREQKQQHETQQMEEKSWQKILS